MAPLSESDRLSLEDLQDAWALLDPEARLEAFRSLDPSVADDFFLALETREQVVFLLTLPEKERRLWLRLLAPDDAADVIQGAPADQRERFLALLDDATRHDVRALLAYAEDDAGGLMNPRYARVRPDMTVDEAIRYLRRQVQERPGSANYAYAIDQDQILRGVVSFRELFAAPADQRISETMQTNLLTVPESMDQEEVSRLFARRHLVALPVVDDQGRMKGVVTADDIVEVLQEEATEDIQKIGGTETLGAPYLEVGLPTMIRKRAGILSVLFVGELLTATAMGHFETELARAVVLALFLPLVISSGGNSGSQATTLVIRAMALGELQLRDWWRVVRREVMAGLGLGAILGALGVVRVLAWQGMFHSYGEHAPMLAIAVGMSVLGVVLWGTVAGSMLPLGLRRVGLDPATSSAPFVATLVDVTGVVIYFTTAKMLLL
jgi:magnesium transporter